MVVLLGALLSESWTSASAGVQAARSSTQAVSTGTFAVVPVLPGGTPGTGALTLGYPALAPPPMYFDAVNTGTLALTAASYSVVVSGGGIGTPSITLTACVGAAWNTSFGTCTGTGVAAVTIGTWTPATSTPIAITTAPTAVGSRLSIQASLTGAIGATTSAVISTIVTSQSPRQVRTASTTSS